MTEERKCKTGVGRAAVLMMASVALNCFLVGLLLAPVLRGVPEGTDGPLPPPPPIMDGAGPNQRPEGGPMVLFGRVLGELSPDEAAKARTIFEEERKDFQDKRKEMRSVMTSVAAILKQDTPDKEAIGKALESVGTSGQALHKGMVRTFERMATELSPESRRKIAAAIEAHEKFMQERGGPHGPRPEGEP